MSWGLALIGGAAAWPLFLWMGRRLAGRRMRVLAALARVRSDGQVLEELPARARPSARSNPRQLANRVGRFFLRGPLQTWAERSLRGAGLPLRPEEFLGITAGALVAGWLVGALLPVGTFVRLLLIACGPLLPPLLVRRARTRRIAAISNQMGDALNTLGNGLRAGHSLPQALDAAAIQIPRPLGEELRRLLHETAAGIPMDEALDRLVARAANPDLELVVTAIRVQRAVGGNLAEVLEKISATIRARVAVQAHLQVITAQSRLSAWIVGLLPIGVFALTTVLAPNVAHTLVADPLGRILAAMALVLEGIGVLVIRRIVSIRY